MLSIQGEVIARTSGANTMRYVAPVSGTLSSSNEPADKAPTRGGNGATAADFASSIERIAEEVTSLRREREALDEEFRKLRAQLKRDLSTIRRRSTAIAFLLVALASATIAAIYRDNADIPFAPIKSNAVSDSRANATVISPAPAQPATAPPPSETASAKKDTPAAVKPSAAGAPAPNRDAIF